MPQDKPKKLEYLALIVDDDEFMASIFVHTLVREGFRVHRAPNGRTGLAAARQEKPDIILLDVVMPDMTGFAVLHELKSDGATKNIPVIMLTSLGQQFDIERGKKEGAFDYLVKTKTVPEAVVDAVRKALAQRDAEKK